MPYGKRNYKRKRKTRKYSKKKYTVSRSKLNDKKINTLIEKRIKDIAKKEVNNNHDKRVFREMGTTWTANMGSYNASLNEFSGTSVSHAGRFDQCCMVPYNPHWPRENGHRESSIIFITGIRLTFKYQLPENNQNVSRESVTLKYAIIRFQDDYTSTGTGGNSGGGYLYNEPMIDDIVPWYPFCYVRKLDDNVDTEKHKFQKKTIIKGQFGIKISELKANSNTIDRYIAFKKPMMIEHFDEAETECKPRKYRFYCGFRASTPDGETDPSQKPLITACVRTYYYESL